MAFMLLSPALEPVGFPRGDEWVREVARQARTPSALSRHYRGQGTETWRGRERP